MRDRKFHDRVSGHDRANVNDSQEAFLFLSSQELVVEVPSLANLVLSYSLEVSIGEGHIFQMDLSVCLGSYFAEKIVGKAA